MITNQTKNKIRMFFKLPIHFEFNNIYPKKEFFNEIDSIQTLSELMICAHEQDFISYKELNYFYKQFKKRQNDKKI